MDFNRRPSRARVGAAGIIAQNGLEEMAGGAETDLGKGRTPQGGYDVDNIFEYALVIALNQVWDMIS